MSHGTGAIRATQRLDGSNAIGTIQIDGMFAELAVADTHLEEQHIPYSNVSFIRDKGRGFSRFSVRGHYLFSNLREYQEYKASASNIKGSICEINYSNHQSSGISLSGTCMSIEVVNKSIVGSSGYNYMAYIHAEFIDDIR